MEANQLVRCQCKHRVGMAFFVDKLDLERGIGKEFDDRSNLATRETVLRNILKKRHYR